ncbi:MAG: hypothetical protein M1822_009973 [Bathelium mastoideum]|nr:MAG: hypothetical protein M1822_009973 [Bathelium mastoideum]
MPSEPGLVIAVLDGHTLTSPTAYYSFDAVSAYNYSPAGLSWLPMTAPQGPTMSAVGKFLTNVIVPVMSSDVSTVPAGYTMLNAIDWSNLNAPVPLLAYIEGWQCWDSTNCSVVYQDDYAPMLAVPLQALNLDPAWSTCLPLEGGVYDPPHALQAAAAAASPTNTFTNAQTTFPITRTSPEPGHTASTILPTSVAIPGEGGTSQPDRGSGDTSDPGNRGGSTSPGAGEKSNPDPGSSDVTGEGNDGSPDSSPGSAPEDSNGRRPDPNSDGSGPDVDTSSDPRPQDPGQRVGGAIVSIVTYSGGNSVPNPGTGDVGNAFDPRPDSGLDDSDAGAAGSIPSSLDHDASPDPQTAPEPAPDQADNEQPESSPAHAIASILGLPNLLAGGTTSPSDKTPEYGGSGGSYNDGDESFDEFGAAAFDSGSESDSGNTSGEPYAFAFAGTRPIFLDPALREAIIVAGQTISPGDPATTIDGTRISVAAGGYMVIGTSVVAIPTATTQADAQNNDASEPGGRWTTFTGTNGALITASEIAGGTLIAAGQTLSIGGPAIEVDGRIVSAASNGLVFVDGSHTSTLAFPETTAPPSLEAALTMADSDIITAFEEPGRSGVVVVGEHTLSPGDIATMDGETISDGPAGLVVLDGTETSRVTFSTAQSGGGGGEAVATRSESDEAARASSSKSDASLAPTVSSSGASMEKFPRQLSFLWVSTIITAVAVGFGT